MMEDDIVSSQPEGPVACFEKKKSLKIFAFKNSYGMYGHV